VISWSEYCGFFFLNDSVGVCLKWVIRFNKNFFFFLRCLNLYLVVEKVEEND
jgi:hypothetical protein